MIQMKKSKIQKVWMKTNVNEMRWNQTKWSETAVLISERMVQHKGPRGPDWMVNTLLEKKLGIRNGQFEVWQVEKYPSLYLNWKSWKRALCTLTDELLLQVVLLAIRSKEIWEGYCRCCPDLIIQGNFFTRTQINLTDIWNKN